MCLARPNLDIASRQMTSAGACAYCITKPGLSDKDTVTYAFAPIAAEIENIENRCAR